ncbi:hypothetical protein F5880DRAFT_1494367 [Lentinula raphanica]|nr:hypothetical protein F5880DRAFT_1494367 [Lentinula raphanica]
MKFDADKDEYEQTRSVRKRKRSSVKPRPTLFSLEKCGARVGELVTHVPLDEAITETDYKHKVLGHFSQGLALRYYSPESITSATAIPQELLQLFRESNHPIFREAPLLQPDNWLFLPDEKVAYTRPGTGSEVFGTVKTVNERGCEIECEEGLEHVSTLYLRKVIIPGDFVRVLHGPRKDSTGLVVAVTIRRVGLISDYDKASHWIDINTVTLTDSSRLVQANFPWKNVEVRILGGFFQGFKAVVKNVWPDGHGSLQVSIFIPTIHHSLEVDYTEIVEYRYASFIYQFSSS